MGKLSKTRPSGKLDFRSFPIGCQLSDTDRRLATAESATDFNNKSVLKQNANDLKVPMTEYGEPIELSDLIGSYIERKPQDIQGSQLLATIHKNEVKIVFYVKLPLNSRKKTHS